MPQEQQRLQSLLDSSRQELGMLMGELAPTSTAGRPPDQQQHSQQHQQEAQPSSGASPWGQALEPMMQAWQLMEAPRCCTQPEHLHLPPALDYLPQLDCGQEEEDALLQLLGTDGLF
jgi:hypothetical protein